MEVIEITLTSKQAALESYLPFVKQGALTLYHSDELNFGQEAELLVRLPELKQELNCKSKVIWISADDYQNEKKYGFQLLGDEGFEINQILENYLVGLIKHDE
ncbi:PilZ domain-containing protein [Cysteiniphilum halobium]|uniref:PilZ domain-containing protein n=1 Tax=Cysteiniphilum halobium TaxID=2219059 RepID=UPI000E64E444|nr:PilZ domain-containing protein [Cysteiniphilum halobium]